MEQHWVFDFPADVSNIREVREGVERMCRKMGFSDQVTLLVVTAVWEATLNAATHGSPNGPDDRVKVTLCSDGNVLHVKITSQNRSFELLNDGPKLDPTGKRGRGLPIIYAFMDEVYLERDEDGITLHMTKKID